MECANASRVGLRAILKISKKIIKFIATNIGMDFSDKDTSPVFQCRLIRGRASKRSCGHWTNKSCGVKQGLDGVMCPPNLPGLKEHTLTHCTHPNTKQLPVRGSSRFPNKGNQTGDTKATTTTRRRRTHKRQLIIPFIHQNAASSVSQATTP